MISEPKSAAVMAYSPALCAFDDPSVGISGRNHRGEDLTKAPWRHNVQDLNTRECKRSGYGMYIRNPRNTYTFYRFDRRGNKLAQRQILNKAGNNDLAVLVSGNYLVRDRILAVSSIQVAPKRFRAQLNPVQKPNPASKPIPNRRSAKRPLSNKEKFKPKPSTGRMGE
jgi:hypothetical protein